MSATVNVEVAGAVMCDAKHAEAVSGKISEFFETLDQHIPTVEGSVKVTTHGEQRLQPGSGQPSKRKGKRSPKVPETG